MVLLAGQNPTAGSLEARYAALERLGIVGGKIYNSPASGNLVTSLASTGGEVVAMDTGPQSYKAGRRYRIPCWIHWSGSSSNIVWEARIREDTVAGTERQYAIAPPSVIGTPYVHFLEAWYEPSVDVTKTMVVTVKVLTGSVTINVSRSGSALAPSATRIEVHDVNLSGKMTSA